MAILSPSELTHIDTPEELERFRKDHQVRIDWHEPDEREINAKTIGDKLDNAFGTAIRHDALIMGFDEIKVLLMEEDEPVAIINLADLLAWGCAAARKGVVNG